MKKILFLTFPIFTIFLLFFSCSKENDDNTTQKEINTYPPWSSLLWQKTFVKNDNGGWNDMAYAFPNMTDYININITDGIAVIFRSYHENTSGSLHSNPNRTFNFESINYIKDASNSEKVGTIKFWNNKKDVSINGDASFEYDIYNLTEYEKNKTGADIKLISLNHTAYYMKIVANSDNPDNKTDTLAVLTTSAASSITAISATIVCNLKNDGGATVTSRGVCWSVSENPTILNSKTNNGTGIGIYTSSATNLSGNKTYYARAYATNSVGTAYGNQVSFTTQSGIISLTTSDYPTTTSNTASIVGNVANDGGAPVLSRGICWSTASNPTIANFKTIDGTGIGTYTSSITGLAGATTYYARAYATNILGTYYGQQITFKTSASKLPALTTSLPTLSSFSAANSGGNITDDGGANILARGVCWSTSQNPTVALNTKTMDGTGIGEFVSSITGLTIYSKYYVKAYATNSVGTSYGNELSFTVGIGGRYQGGIIAYILQSGDNGYSPSQIHGLIAAPSDQSANIQWYNGSFTNTLATETSLGTGNANTNKIVAIQGTGSYAAKICYDLDLGGYTDWYLPSKDELNKLFINRVAIGGFSANWYYWSSSEYNTSYSWLQNFNASGVKTYTTKENAFPIRAVRSF